MIKREVKFTDEEFKPIATLLGGKSFPKWAKTVLLEAAKLPGGIAITRDLTVEEEELLRGALDIVRNGTEELQGILRDLVRALGKRRRYNA